jgi:adenosine deaminase
MLKRSLQELAVAAFFNNVELSARLRFFLLKNEQDIIDLLNTYPDDMALSFESVYSAQFRENDVKKIFSSILPKRLFLESDIPLLDDIFHQLMFRNGDHIQYREEQVQSFSKLAIDLDPTVIVGWHIAGAIRGSEQFAQNDLLRIIPNQYPFFCPPSSHEKMYADGHVHWGGIAFGNLFITEKVMSEATKKWSHYSMLRNCLFVILTSDTRQADLASNFRLALDEKQTIKNFSNLDWKSIESTYSSTTNIDKSWLTYILSKSVNARKYAEAWSWLVCLLWYIYRASDTDSIVRVAIFHMFMVMSNIRKSGIMDGRGLANFLSVTKLGTLNDAITSEHRRRILPGTRDVAEIKMATNVFNVKKLSALEASSQSMKFMRNANTSVAEPHIAHRKELEHIQQLERMHFCLHFLRKDRKDQAIDAVRKELWKETTTLEEIFGTQEMWTESRFIEDIFLPRYKYQAGRWIRGLDVAGNENVQRIEEHAPMLRWLRRGLIRASHSQLPTPGPHLSIHAGEDYAHPLSGLRHIDETVRFCEMRAGDRIGHALALGLQPKNWIKTHGDMMLSAEEHLDNLVWAWHIAIVLSPSLSIAAQIIPRIEQRITRMIPYVSWALKKHNQNLMFDSISIDVHEPILISRPPTPSALYGAWKFRRNCHHIFMISQQLKDDKTYIAVPDFDHLHHAATSVLETGTAEWLYFEREAYLRKIKTATQFSVLIRPCLDQDPPYSKRDTEDSPLIYDYETDADLDFIYAAQDYLMARYDRLGLLIETNPTSNVCIAKIDRHADHPIFRWSPPDGKLMEPGEKYNKHGLRKGPMRVLINTDDPGIMPTTLRTEYSLILEAAVDLGYSRATTEDWLDQIRLRGIDQFRRNHLPVFTGKDGEDLYATS